MTSLPTAAIRYVGQRTRTTEINVLRIAINQGGPSDAETRQKVRSALQSVGSEDVLAELASWRALREGYLWGWVYPDLAADRLGVGEADGQR